MKDTYQQAMSHLVAAQLHLRFGRHDKADVILRAAWRVFADGLDMEAVSETDLLRFAVMARVAGVGATPESALARVRSAISG